MPTDDANADDDADDDDENGPAALAWLPVDDDAADAPLRSGVVGFAIAADDVFVADDDKRLLLLPLLPPLLLFL